MTKALTFCITILALASSLQAQSTDQKLMDHSKMDHSAHMQMMADAQRQAEVSQRGKDVMPFNLAATTHVFSKRADGGIQQVIAKNPQDKVQVKLVRQHLQQIRDEFLKGDFSGPTHIHGQSMPGLAELQMAKSDQIAIAYENVKSGAALTYKTIDPSLVIALHKWFDAQFSDHGKDAMEGHHDHLGEMKKP